MSEKFSSGTKNSKQTLMAISDAFDYDILKKPLSCRFELKEKVRPGRPDSSENFSELAFLVIFW